MDTSATATRIAVIGVGNDYRRDDGVGRAVVTRLAQRGQYRPLSRGVTLMCTDGEPTRLIGAWEDVRLAVIVDAAHARPARPGRVHRLRLRLRLRLDGDLPQTRWGETSSHGFALGDAVRLARALGRLPGALLVYAVEAADTRLGTGLSPPVAAAVGPLVQRIEEDLVRHAPAVGETGLLAPAPRHTAR
ncbi:hydrogenase maturation protease [Streptomyces sp. DSM 41527]|uniref:Hydrogenase maturation protease n=1 Tax=Streptomyces mooreae TaxID=3075523 RepID=A0ABU2T8U0_9ACTN|nr:hydrogenase maturation protease [Streptomyces sp. DSM 41527]MDT0457331.1 hydrogenase maturation protease [Streptomyces sp. DSM 41527]